ADTGCLPRGRLDDQHHHAAHAVLSAGGGVRAALREEHRHRHARVADAPVLDRLPDVVDGAAARLLGAGTAAGTAGGLRIPGLSGTLEVRRWKFELPTRLPTSHF